MNPIKMMTIIGARPQIIKAAAISRAIRNNFKDQIHEILVHTGQHYDENMSQVFFDELEIPKPDYNLDIGSGNHSSQTAKMLLALGELIEKVKPRLILLYGDTNSTVAAALAGSKVHIPIVHIEGGLRSFKKSYPEEINRILTDHVSTLIFTPTKNGFQNLLAEGFKENPKLPFTVDNPKVYHCGDIMYDNSMYYAQYSSNKTQVIKTLRLERNNFVLVTIHRDNNTDNATRLNGIFRAIVQLSQSEKIKFILPLHPRTAKILHSVLAAELSEQVKNSEWIQIIPPTSFFEIIELEKNAKIIITDSGGVQKEAFFFKKPSIILLHETPWVELVESGAALLADADENKIVEAYQHFKKNEMTLTYPPFYGDGQAASFICKEIINCFSSN